MTVAMNCGAVFLVGVVMGITHLCSLCDSVKSGNGTSPLLQMTDVRHEFLVQGRLLENAAVRILIQAT